jgi:hypothetical protein
MEQLDPQLLEVDVDRRAERRHGGEVAVHDTVDPERHLDHRSSGGRQLGRLELCGELVDQGLQLVIGHPADRLAPGAGDERGCQLRPVVDERSERAEHQPQHVHGGLDLVEGDELPEELSGAVVGAHEVPVPVHHDPREWFVGPEDPVERRQHVVGSRIVETELTVRRRVAGGEEQVVAIAQRHLQRLGERVQHLPARLRASRLDEADMAGRHPGPRRQVELAHPPLRAPRREHDTRLTLRPPAGPPVLDRRRRHVRTLRAVGLDVTSLGGNWPAPLPRS